MSSLQVGLAVAGGLILGGVIAHNTWNARRNEPRQAQPESQPAPLVAHGADLLAVVHGLFGAESAREVTLRAKAFNTLLSI